MSREKKASACERRANILRLVNKNPRITAREIVEEQSSSGVGVCRYTDGRVLKRIGLKVCYPRKTPFLKPVHLKVRPEFAKSHIDKDAAFWKQVLWSDETKIEFFDHNSVSYVYRKSGEGFLFKNTIPTAKHGRGSLMFR